MPLAIVPGGVFFLRGDANDDGKVNVADAIWSLNELMRGGPPTVCPRASDFNGDGARDVSDAVYLVQYLFLKRPTPPAPYPDCSAAGEQDEQPCPAGVLLSCP